MMHRGELAHHRLDDVLRTAAAERLTGGIEIDGGPTLCIYLDDGAVYLAVRAGEDPDLGVDDAMDDAAFEAARRADEERLRPASVTVLAEALGREQGWYFFHHLTEHPAQGLWRWPVEDLLADAGPDPASADEDGAGTADPLSEVAPAPGDGALDGRAPRAPASVDGRPPPRLGPETSAPDPAGPPPGPEEADPTPPPAEAPEQAEADGVRWRLSPSAPAGPVDEATWAVLVAMAGRVDQATVTARLGWSVEQAQTAIGRLVARGVLLPVDDVPPDDLVGGRVRRLTR